MQNTMILCLIIGFIAWYYFNKFQESEREYLKLHQRFTEICNENIRVKSRLKDLQSYKNDVSKTFKILDNELLMINDHIKKQQGGTNDTSQTSTHNVNTTSNRVSILTPSILSTLFSTVQREEEQTSTTPDQNDLPALASLSYNISYGTPRDYTRFLINENDQQQNQETNQQEDQ